MWPEKPTCHDGAQRFSKSEIAWRAPRNDLEYGRSEPYRTCSYCGSMHPEDLVRLLETDPRVKLGGSDWKYGWPHKFYVDVPNLTPGIPASTGSRSRTVDGVTTTEPIMGTSSATLMAKFYSEHLTDAGYGETQRETLIGLLEKHGGILFYLDPEKGLTWRAPHHGYQR